MTLLALTPASKQRLADVLYGQLLEQITSGVLVPGSKLPTENDLCKAFAVSRPVVRQALMRLQADGLVESRRGSGTYLLHAPSAEINRFIEPADFSSYLRAYEVRIVLEPRAARLAAERRQPEDLTVLNTACRDLELAVKAGANARQHDLAFHMAIARSTGNELFARQLHNLDTELEGLMSVSLGLTGLGSIERKKTVLEEHRQIVSAIADGDADLAETYMRYHLSQARRRLTDVNSQP